MKPASSDSRPNAASIQARVDTLVLRGFAPVDANRVQRAFTVELDAGLRRIAPAMTAWSSRDLDRVPSIRIQLEPNARPEVIGRRIARAVVRALTSPADDER